MGDSRISSLTPEAQALWDAVRPASCPITVSHPVPINTHIMLGDGPVPALGMVILDAPTGHEDKVGRPLPSEWLLHLFRDAGIDPSQLYFTFLSKCAVPKEQREKFTHDAWPEYLEFIRREIELVKPRTILTMGALPAEATTGVTGITKHRGEELHSEQFDLDFVLTVDAGYAEKRPHFVKLLLSDCEKFGRKLRGETVDQTVQVVWCNTVDEVRGALDALDKVPGSVTSLDLETRNYYDYFPSSKIWCAALSKDPTRSYVIPLEHPDSPFMRPWKTNADGSRVPFPAPKVAKKDPEARAWIEGRWQDQCTDDLGKVYEILKSWFCLRRVNGHNIKYDARHFARRGIRFTIFFDTMASAHLLDENRSLSLLDRMSSEYGFHNWGKRQVSFDPPDDLEKMGQYCGEDTAHSHRLFFKDKEELQRRQNLARLFKLLVIPGLQALLDMELNGIWLDLEVLERQLSEHRRRVDVLTAEIQEYVDPLFREQANFNSPDFLRKWLYADPPSGLGLSAAHRTPKGKLSTDERSLDALSGAHPAADKLLELRKHEKAISFLMKWRELSGPDACLHPFYNMSGTVTGRRSCSRPNLQQVPREGTHAGLRSCMGAPDGWTFMECDYSQIELRIAALESRDPVMLKAYRLGRDLHVLTAAMVTRKLFDLQEKMGLTDRSVEQLLENDEFCRRLAETVTKEERRMAKAVNFGFLYGMGWRKFGIYAKTTYDVDITDLQAKEFREMFFALYGGLIAWHKQRRYEARKYLRVTSLIGRERHLPMILSNDEAVAATAERQGINAPVQGLGGDLAALSCGVLNPIFLEHAEQVGEVTAKLVGDVHDAVYFLIKDGWLSYWAPIIRRAMEHPPLGEKFGFEPDIPILVEPKVGKYWGCLDDYVEAA